ncbi:MAG: copper-binding protein [Thermodesulfobacteriota bacterium]
MKRRIIAIALAMGIAYATGAFAHGDEAHGKKGKAADDNAAVVGKPGDPGKVTRTIGVDMNDDMRFLPDNIRVERGETIRFIVRNVGKMKHEMVIGTIRELKEHAELMRKYPEMEHEEPNQVVVDPGRTGELVWQFTRSGTFDFACLVPGHFEAGMAGTIRVGGGDAMSEGVVTKVDRSAGKVTLRHGPMENLGMPKMTMIFRVKDPAMLEELKEGRKIRFLAEKVDGAITLIRVEAAE